MYLLTFEIILRRKNNVQALNFLDVNGDRVVSAQELRGLEKEIRRVRRLEYAQNHDLEKYVQEENRRRQIEQKILEKEKKENRRVEIMKKERKRAIELRKMKEKKELEEHKRKAKQRADKEMEQV